MKQTNLPSEPLENSSFSYCVKSQSKNWEGVIHFSLHICGYTCPLKFFKYTQQNSIFVMYSSKDIDKHNSHVSTSTLKTQNSIFTPQNQHLDGSLQSASLSPTLGSDNLFSYSFAFCRYHINEIIQYIDLWILYICKSISFLNILLHRFCYMLFFHVKKKGNHTNFPLKA